MGAAAARGDGRVMPERSPLRPEIQGLRAVAVALVVLHHLWPGALPGGFVRLADLTRFMCDARRCFPVVGGALVHKDEHHMTTVCARTLWPYLARRVDRLVKGA